MEFRYQTHLSLKWPRLMFLTIYWWIGWCPSPTFPSRWQSESLQGREEGPSARVICRISKLDSKRERGGIRGRGHRRGCGGPGGHHSVSDKHNPAKGWFHGVDCSDFRRLFSGEEVNKAGSDGRLYVFNNQKIDKDTRHIQKVQHGGTDDGKELDLKPYFGEANGNINLGGNENPNESKEQRSAQ